MRLDAALRGAIKRLSPTSESARLDAEILLCRTIDMPRSYLFAHPEDVLDELTIERFDALIERRADGEPMAYIMGTREFWSLELAVSRDTLVPRPETELLVDLALREIPRRAEWRLLDLGTGSGAIAIALARERPLCDVTGVDINGAAVRMARENARQHSIPNIRFLEGDWTAPVEDGVFNVIVSNPPYVRAGDAALADLRYEPRDALVAGADGLDAIRVLAADCGRLLHSDGVLLLEHGADQADDVAAILGASHWTGIVNHRDYSGHPRVTVAHRGGK